MVYVRNEASIRLSLVKLKLYLGCEIEMKKYLEIYNAQKYGFSKAN